MRTTVEPHESIEDTLSGFICVCATRKFRKVLIERYLAKKEIEDEAVGRMDRMDRTIRGWIIGERIFCGRTSWSLALNSSIPVKNKIIDIRTNQGELITCSKRLRYSANRV